MNATIYLIQSGEYYKIGRTRDINKRMNGFYCNNPQVRLIGTYNASDGKKDEKRWHDKFKDKHYRGEWYKLNRTDIPKIFKDVQL